MGENINESVAQIKDTMIETVNGITDSIGNEFNDGMRKNPLNESMNMTNHLLEENLENLKNEILNKENIEDETNRSTDELIKDTEDVIRDAETGMIDIKNNTFETFEAMKDEITEKMSLKSSHSMETIERPDLNPFDDNETSIEATVGELSNLNMEEVSPLSSTEERNDETIIVDSPATEIQSKKNENDLVVEDIKDE